MQEGGEGGGTVEKVGEGGVEVWGELGDIVDTLRSAWTAICQERTFINVMCGTL